MVSCYHSIYSRAHWILWITILNSNTNLQNERINFTAKISLCYLYLIAIFFHQHWFNDGLKYQPNFIPKQSNTGVIIECFRFSHGTIIGVHKPASFFLFLAKKKKSDTTRFCKNVVVSEQVKNMVAVQHFSISKKAHLPTTTITITEQPKKCKIIQSGQTANDSSC